MNSNLRLFLGVPLPLEARKPITVLQEQAKAQLGGWRVVPAENWHLTVHFLGEVESTKVPPLEKWLRSLSIPKLPAITWSRWNGFPSPERATTVGLAAETAPAWKTWVKKLGDELDKLGFPTEKRPFIPHLTLFRRREATSVILPTFPSGLPFRPLSLCLFESRLTPSGSRYLARVEKALTASASSIL